jgi:hypothetical protein
MWEKVGHVLIITGPGHLGGCNSQKTKPYGTAKAVPKKKLHRPMSHAAV